jgi:hypothetical protein
MSSGLEQSQWMLRMCPMISPLSIPLGCKEDRGCRDRGSLIFEQCGWTILIYFPYLSILLHLQLILFYGSNHHPYLFTIIIAVLTSCSLCGKDWSLFGTLIQIRVKVKLDLSVLLFSLLTAGVHGSNSGIRFAMVGSSVVCETPAQHKKRYSTVMTYVWCGIWVARLVVFPQGTTWIVGSTRIYGQVWGPDADYFMVG